MTVTTVNGGTCAEFDCEVDGDSVTVTNVTEGVLLGYTVIVFSDRELDSEETGVPVTVTTVNGSVWAWEIEVSAEAPGVTVIVSSE